MSVVGKFLNVSVKYLADHPEYGNSMIPVPTENGEKSPSYICVNLLRTLLLSNNNPIIFLTSNLSLVSANFGRSHDNVANYPNLTKEDCLFYHENGKCGGKMKVCNIVICSGSRLHYEVMTAVFCKNHADALAIDRDYMGDIEDFLNVCKEIMKVQIADDKNWWGKNKDRYLRQEVCRYDLYNWRSAFGDKNAKHFEFNVKFRDNRSKEVWIDVPESASADNNDFGIIMWGKFRCSAGPIKIPENSPVKMPPGFTFAPLF